MSYNCCTDTKNILPIAKIRRFFNLLYLKSNLGALITLIQYTL